MFKFKFRYKIRSLEEIFDIFIMITNKRLSSRSRFLKNVLHQFLIQNHF